MYYPGNWIHSFPQNFQWSNATLVCKGMAPYGAVALGEIDWIVQKLHQRADQPNAGDAWHEEWCAVADKVAAVADLAASEGRSATAGNNYLHAGNYYYTGERMVPPGELKTAIYRKALRCFQEGLKRRYPNLEIVDVPYEGSALPAYFLKSPYAQGPAPTVVLFDELDNCKEMSVLFAGAELAYRGFHTLAGVADRIKCPFLIMWGTQDKLTPREVAHQLHDNVGSQDKTLKIFDEDEGGAEHCQVDNRQVGTDYMADWLSARLLK